MQYSVLNGSQAGSGVTVIVGVTDGIVVAVGDGDADVAITSLFAAVGV